MSTDALRKLPKAELHRHLEGALRFSTLLELAPTVGLSVPAKKMEQEDYFLVKAPMVDLGSVLRKFMNTQAVLHSEEILARITYEAIEDAANEGIRILELRFAPTFILENHSSLDFQKVHRAIAQGLSLAKNLPIAVGLVGIIQRTKDLVLSSQAMDLFIENRQAYVGVDLADNEELGEPGPFKDLFHRAHKAGLPITIHSGETPSPKAGQRIKDAVEILGARRIGHGLQCIHFPEVISFLKKENIVLELCPTSNWLTQSIPSIKEHPFRRLMEMGVQVCLNSDDPGIFGIDLTHEYEVLRTHFEFSETEFAKINDTAARASFIPLEQKQRHWPRPISP